jgi:hypothetical protein
LFFSYTNQPSFARQCLLGRKTLLVLLVVVLVVGMAAAILLRDSRCAAVEHWQLLKHLLGLDVLKKKYLDE